MFFFEFSPKKINSQPKEKNHLCAYIPVPPPDALTFSTTIERGYREKVTPLTVTFVCPDYLFDDLKQFFALEDILLTAERFGARTRVSLISFGKLGDYARSHIICEGAIRPPLENDDLLAVIAVSGVYELARCNLNEVILMSPPGTVFGKPSKKSSDEFIKAAGLATNSSEHHFLAFSLLRHHPPSIDVQCIYIDTAGIAAIAESLCTIINQFRLAEDEDPVTLYESFGSYDGIETQKPQLVKNAWVIISASHSNSLGKRLFKDWNLSHSQIITILSYRDGSPDENGDQTLLNISGLSSSGPGRSSDSSSLIVSIHGEHFTAQVADSVKILIKISHKPNVLAKLLRVFDRESTAVSCQHTCKNSSLKPVYLDLSKMKPEAFDDWAAQALRLNLTASTTWLISDLEDKNDVFFTELVCHQLTAVLNAELKVCDIKNAAITVGKNDGVLICKGVISSGRSLINLNRELRLAGHQGSRTFMVALATPSSKSQHASFILSLCQGPNGFKYPYLEHTAVAIGNASKNSSWDDELRFISNFDGDHWNARRTALEQKEYGLKGHLGMGLESGESHYFTTHFAFWPGEKYTPDTVSEAQVYLTISAILQKLRDTAYEESRADSLQSHVYQHAILDPDNFVRFNDPLIQTCLWRAATNSELDYRDSEDASEYFVKIVATYAAQLNEDIDQSNSYVVFDFLIAVCTQKIQLTERGYRDLYVQAVKPLKKNPIALDIECFYLNAFERMLTLEPKV